MRLWKLVRAIIDETDGKTYKDVEILTIITIVVRAWTRINEGED